MISTKHCSGQVAEYGVEAVEKSLFWVTPLLATIAPLYLRLPRLLQALPITKGDGTYARFLTRLAKVDVLILDDLGLSKLIAEQRRDLLEILEDRHDSRSTIVTSQLPLDQWHHIIGDPTLADATPNVDDPVGRHNSKHVLNSYLIAT